MAKKRTLTDDSVAKALALTLCGGKKPLNGDLQDCFLAAIERSERSAGR